MKKLILSTTALLCSLGLFAQTGTWSGQLEIGDSHLMLEFTFDGDQCTLAVPAQGAKGISAQLSKPLPGMISIQVPMIGASFDGLMKSNELIEGTFRQNGLTLPLRLSPGVQQRRRPQTPVGPFPYTTEEVSWSNGDATLSGTLTLPKEFSLSTPVVVLVTGSGMQNRDEELMEHKPFAVLADALARQGIATLRYDDRGCAQSTGNFQTATTYDFRDDAFGGITLLRQRGFRRVGVMGHSEGGTIALLLASEGKVDFAISLAGMALSGKETLIQQNRDIMLASQVPQATVDLYCQALDEIFTATINNKGFTNANAYKGLGPQLQNNLYAVVDQAQSPWFRSFLAINPEKELKKIHCPLLALNGTKDIQVNAERNLAVIQQEVPQATVRSFPDLNHLFQHCTTGMVNEYIEIEETISPEVIQTIIGWIKK